MLPTPKTFCTYLWLRDDGTPYYVGKTGDPKRPYRDNSPKDPDRIIVQEHLSESDAYTAEKFFISYFGRKDNKTGVLRNFTDGGEGLTGRIFSKAHRDGIKRNNAMKNPEHRKKISDAHKGRRAPWACRKGSAHPMWGKPNPKLQRMLIEDPPMRRPKSKAKWLLTRTLHLDIKKVLKWLRDNRESNPTTLDRKSA